MDLETHSIKRIWKKNKKKKTSPLSFLARRPTVLFPQPALFLVSAGPARVSPPFPSPLHWPTRRPVARAFLHTAPHARAAQPSTPSAQPSARTRTRRPLSPFSFTASLAPSVSHRPLPFFFPCSFPSQPPGDGAATMAGRRSSAPTWKATNPPQRPAPLPSTQRPSGL